MFVFWTSTRVSSSDKPPSLAKRELSNGPRVVLLSSRSRRDGGIFGSDPDGDDPVPFTTKRESPSSAKIPSAEMLSGTPGLVNVS